MKKLIFILLFIPLFGFSQEYTDFLPDVAWRTLVDSVVYQNTDTFTVKVNPLDLNDPGAFDKEVGNFLIDNKRRKYKIIDNSTLSDGVLITVVDVFDSGAAPFQGLVGFVVKSPNGSFASGLSTYFGEKLDELTADYERAIDLRIAYEKGQSIPFDSMRLDTGYTPTGTEPVGTSYWDEENRTYSDVLKDGVIGQRHKEFFIDGQNNTGTLIPNGTPVMYAGSIGNSGNIRIKPADIDSITPALYFVGVVTKDIPNDSTGEVTTIGKVRGWQTDGVDYGESWSAGDIIYPKNGGWTNVEPQAPYPAIAAALVISAHPTNGTILVRPNMPQRLTELSDVNGTPLEDGSMLVYDSARMVHDFTFNVNNIIPDSIWNNINSAARLYGGEITDNGDGTVHINAGAGIIKTDEAGPEDIPQSINGGQGSILAYVSWDEVASLALTDNAYNFIYWDGSAGQMKATTDFYSISFTQDFTVGRAYREGTNVIARLCGTNAWNFNRRVQLFGEEVFPVVRGTGLIISEAGTLQFNISSGVLWAELVNRFSVPAFDGTTTPFYYWLRDGRGGWNKFTDSSIDNINYDDNSGYPAALIAQRYGVHWVFEDHEGTVHVVYGRDSYTEAEAALAVVPFDLPGIIDAYATLIGKIVVQKNSTTFHTIQSAFEQQFGFEEIPIANHNDLIGLDGGEPGYYGHITTTERQEWNNAADSIPALRTDIDSALNYGLEDVLRNNNDGGNYGAKFGDAVRIDKNPLIGDSFTNGAMFVTENYGTNIIYQLGYSLAPVNYYFGDEHDAEAGGFAYANAIDRLSILAGSEIQLEIDSDGTTIRDELEVDGNAIADQATLDTHLPTWGQVKQNISDSIQFAKDSIIDLRADINQNASDIETLDNSVVKTVNSIAPTLGNVDVTNPTTGYLPYNAGGYFGDSPILFDGNFATFFGQAFFTAFKVTTIGDTNFDIIADSNNLSSTSNTRIRLYKDETTAVGTIAYNESNDILTMSKGTMGKYHFNIFNSGNIGIGTTTDNGRKLNVAGGGYFSSTVEHDSHLGNGVDYSATLGDVYGIVSDSVSDFYTKTESDSRYLQTESQDLDDVLTIGNQTDISIEFEADEGSSELGLDWYFSAVPTLKRSSIKSELTVDGNQSYFHQDLVFKNIAALNYSTDATETFRLSSTGQKSSAKYGVGTFEDNSPAYIAGYNSSGKEIEIDPDSLISGSSQWTDDGVDEIYPNIDRNIRMGNGSSVDRWILSQDGASDDAFPDFRFFHDESALTYALQKRTTGSWIDVWKINDANSSKFELRYGDQVDEISNDGTLSGNAQDVLVTEYAVKTYVDAQSGSGGTVTSVGITGSDFNITGSPVTTSGNIGISIANGVVDSTELASTTVTAGSYTNANITVDSDGRITTASSSSFSGAKVSNTSNQTIDSTGTTVLFNTEDFDTDSYHSTSTNTDRITIPSDGYYRVTFNGCVQVVTIGELGGLDFALKSGNTTIADISNYDGDKGDLQSNINYSDIFYLTEDEYLTVVLTVRSTTASLFGDSRLSFSIEKL